MLKHALCRLILQTRGMGIGWIRTEVAFVPDAKLRASLVKEAAQLLADPAVAEGGLHSQE